MFKNLIISIKVFHIKYKIILTKKSNKNVLNKLRDIASKCKKTFNTFRNKIFNKQTTNCQQI